MISLIMESALFLLVLFVVGPAMVICFLVGRDALHHSHKSATWDRDAMGKLLSQ
jgi:hypothetical protein